MKGWIKIFSGRLDMEEEKISKLEVGQEKYPEWSIKNKKNEEKRA